jgi:hypothetical protein
VAAMAKEGENVPDEVKNEKIKAWMSTGVESINNKFAEEPIFEFGSSDEESEMIITQYINKPLVVGLMNGIFDEPVYDEKPTVAQRYNYPLEVVLVLDGSSSVAAERTNMDNIIKEVIEGLFPDEPVDETLKVAIVAHAGDVNVGFELAKKITKPSSRKLYYGTTEAEHVNYYKRLATLAEYGKEHLADDLLGPGGIGEAVNYAFVKRWELPPPGPLVKMPAQGMGHAGTKYYAEHIDDPINDLENDGFNLIVGDGRVLDMTYASSPYTTLTKYTYVTNSAKYDVHWPNLDVLDLAYLPHEHIIDIQRTNPTQYKKWCGGTGLSTSYWPKCIESVIGIHSLSAPNAPILYGVNDKNELLDYLGKISFGGGVTAGDDGMAWAIRLLSPKWKDIWDKGDDYPAEFHSTTEKRIIMTMGSQNGNGYSFYTTQYPQGSWAWTDLCNVVVERGIDVYMTIEYNANAPSKAAGKVCTQQNIYPERYYELKQANYGDAASKMKEFATQRKYYVRLVQ